MKVETQLPLGKVDPGLRSAAKLDLASVPGGAREIEELGFDGMVTGEIKTDPFIPLALAAPPTGRLRLTAQGHLERRYSGAWAPPVPRLREYILALRAIWDCWQHGTRLNVRGTHYPFSVMVPLFNPGPIAHPDIPIHIAAINKHMYQLAGEMCEGIRPHPITTRKFITEIMLPNVEFGAKKAGRPLENFDVAISPLVAAADNETELADRIRDIRARIAFYASTRTYKSVFDAHGWGSLVDELHGLSTQQRWEEMPKYVTDEVLETIAVVGTYEDVARKIKGRYGDFATRVEFSLPVRSPADHNRVRAVMRELHEG